MSNQHWQIAITKKTPDPEERALINSLYEIGIDTIRKVKIFNVFYLSGNLSYKEVINLTRNYLYDPVIEQYTILEITKKTPSRTYLSRKKEIEVIYKLGVTDPVAEQVTKALFELGYKDLEIRTAKRYRFWGEVTPNELNCLAQKLLYNPLIQEIITPPQRVHFLEELILAHQAFTVRYLEILNKSLDELMALSQKNLWALNAAELKAIQNYYRKLGRNPTDIEMETFAQTWSEHCKHKTFNARIIYYQGKKKKIINGLFSTYIKKSTYELNKPWCLSVFEDNSGVIEFDQRHGITFKVETHNHPSALEPYGGASTGIGGVIRDCLGTGLGAKPIANTDVFCFAPPDIDAKKLPPGLLSPRQIIKGVVYGVRDYGNRMGIPTVSGAVTFDERYLGNPLVFCGTIGLIPKNKIKKRICPGDLIVLIGGRTGRDGIHGVTFASLELRTEQQKIASQVVQIGNPIEEKKITDLMLVARDKNLFNATTDCGGGGLSSAIGELARGGAVVELDKVPLKYKGLHYTEIWISESQERMILFVPSKKLKALEKLAKTFDVEITVIGRLTDNKKLILKYQGKVVGELDLDFLHNGLPQKNLVAISPSSYCKHNHRSKRNIIDYNQEILKLLGSYNIASKEWIVRQYDFEVQGHTIIKPFVGKNNGGPSDSVVIKPSVKSNKGVAIGCGLGYEKPGITCYQMASLAIDEALRNVVAVGGDPQQTALLDNFSWGNPENPEVLGGLVDACKACYDIAKIYEVPFISGKDSLYNEYKAATGKIFRIPGTLLISAISIVPDIKNIVTMDFKAPDELIYLIGKPTVFDPRLAKRIFATLHRLIRDGLISACHDISDGGLAIALAEMCIAGELGAEVYLNNFQINARDGKRDEVTAKLLFDENSTQFIVTVRLDRKAQFEKIMKYLPYYLIGKTTNKLSMKVWDPTDRLVVELPIEYLTKIWTNTLSAVLSRNS
jgi:phosphoribosylformylglycinamidine synthase